MRTPTSIAAALALAAATFFTAAAPATAVAQSIPGFADIALTPLSQQNAIDAASSYLEMSGFSASGLVKQLEYEGYSAADATNAVQSLGADWNQQAVRVAKNYLDMTSFSRSGLIQQLVYDGFTPSQAAYGVAATGL